MQKDFRPVVYIPHISGRSFSFKPITFERETGEGGMTLVMLRMTALCSCAARTCPIIIGHAARYPRSPNPKGFDPSYHQNNLLSPRCGDASLSGGEGGIRNLAAEKIHPTGLANPPLQPLGYLSAMWLNFTAYYSGNG